MRDRVIAIDGPAGAGKSTVSKLLAQRLGWRLLDTGAMYRCVALQAHRTGMSALADAETLAELARACEIDFGKGDPQPVRLNGDDVTDAIRSLEIGQLASAISQHGPVRRVLVERQQAAIRAGEYVLEGRDVTTVVAPNAELKIFLTASIEERARRRWLERKAKGETTALQSVVLDVLARDYRDYTRTDSPLMLADEAIIVETFGLTPEQVVAKLVALLEE